MEQEMMASIKWLRKTFATLAKTSKNDPELIAKSILSGKLLDRMIVENTVAPGIRAQFHADVIAILLDAESVLSDWQKTSSAGAFGDGLSDIIQEMKTIAAVYDSAAFDRFSQLAASLQRGLLAAGSPETITLTKSLLTVEADYHARFETAVTAQSVRAMAEPKGGSAAANFGKYDEAKLLDFLHRKFPEESELKIANSAFISGGFSKITLGITLRNTNSLPQEVILRADVSTMNGGVTIYGGVSVVQEYRLFQILSSHGVCIPKPLAVEDTGREFGVPFMLTERRPGRTIGDMFHLPAQNLKTCDDVARTLAAIHQVPLAAVEHHFGGAATRSSAKILAWIDEAEANFRPLGISSMVFESAFDWLRRNVHLNDEAPRTLVHADYGLHNILINGDLVSAVLDWEFAHIGNPAYDLGYFYCMAQTLGSWDGFLRAYGEAGSPIPDQRQLDYHLLFATTRLAVMACQSGALFTSRPDVPPIVVGVIADGIFNENIKRISDALERVL